MSGAVVRVSDDVASALECNDVGRLSEADKDQLAEVYAVVPDDLDELSILKQRYETGRHDRSHLGMTVITSLGCNFDCPYCYESKRPDLLKTEVSQALRDLVRSRSESLRSLQVSWLGGEPLMAYRQLLTLSADLQQIAQNAGAVYFSNVTTNGYLLDRAKAIALREVGIAFAQVCIDGPPDVHDRMRPLASGRGTFDRIVRNIEEVADVLDITVRVNVDHENIGRVEELFELLGAHGLAGRVTIYAGQLVKVDDEAPVPSPSAHYSPSCFTGSEFAAVEAEFVRKATEFGFNRPSLPGPILTPCTAVREDEFVIGSSGELYKCWENVGNEKCTVGTIFDPESAETSERLVGWTEYSPFSDDECRKCIALPSCMGGCLHHLKDENLRHSRCSTFRHNHREQIATFVDQMSGSSARTAFAHKPATTDDPQLVDGSNRRLLPIVSTRSCG
ncbi:radical SAM protein [Gordonia rubripertincta]|uniref:radical SAM protein n=1 Tax=Gordonia rubripertincta TaxID=36822 RepID=UPI0036F460EE